MIHYRSIQRFIGTTISFAVLTLFAYGTTLWARSISPFPQDAVKIEDLRGNNYQSYYFYVTGSLTGSIWGTDVYTDDSDLATAAVHAGVLRPGEKGIVKVTILPGQSEYTGSTKNGVTSYGYDAFDGSYSVSPDDGGDNPPIPVPTNFDLEDFEDYPGNVYHFIVTGDVDAGTVWGTNVYTSDSPLSKAAIHAGLLTDGRQATVRVIIVPGQDHYIGTFRNGVQSEDYDAWGGSYMVTDYYGTTSLIPYPGGPENPLPDPGDLESYEDFLGGAYYFTVTGDVDGEIFGTGVYTSDSDLSTAAVHAGILSPGETGTVKVTILPGQSSYQGSTAHGITSRSYGEWDSSYRVEAPDGELGDIPVIKGTGFALYSVGTNFQYRIETTQKATKYDALGLPAGLSIDRVNGIISGVPELTGRFPVELRATNSAGTSATTLVLRSDGLVSQTNCLLDWAEANFPDVLGPGGADTFFFRGFALRFYPSSNLYLGSYLNRHLFAYSPQITHGMIMDLGPIDPFLDVSNCK